MKVPNYFVCAENETHIFVMCLAHVMNRDEIQQFVLPPGERGRTEVPGPRGRQPTDSKTLK